MVGPKYGRRQSNQIENSHPIMKSTQIIDTLSASQKEALTQKLCDYLGQPNSPHSQKLVAYTVPQHSNDSTSTEDITKFLSENLPAHMVPRHIFSIDALPLTSNGKVDRQSLATKAINTPQPPIAQLKRSDDTEILLNIWREALNNPAVTIDDNFFHLGGDSIMAIEMISKARQAGFKISVSSLYQNPTISQLARQQKKSQPATHPQDSIIIGSAPLTPIQHWFFEQQFPNPHHWNQSVILDLSESIEISNLQKSFIALCKHHDALRLCFKHSKITGWSQINAHFNDSLFIIEKVNLAEISPDQQISNRDQTIEKLNRGMSLNTGCLIKAALFDYGEHRASQLFLTIHHIATDSFSWRLLLSDLDTLLQGQSVPMKTTSFKKWSEALSEHALSQLIVSKFQYWAVNQHRKHAQIPTDSNISEKPNESQSTNYLQRFSETDTQAIEAFISETSTNHSSILISALAYSLNNWSQSTSFLIGIEGHGRDDIINDIDLSRTVGWFTSFYPYHLEIIPQEDHSNALQRISQSLKSIGGNGIYYGINHYLKPQQSEATNLHSAQPEIIFNFLGKQSIETQNYSSFTPASDTPPYSRDLDAPLTSKLEINAHIKEKQLEVSWRYSKKLFQSDTIKKLNSLLVEHVNSLVNTQNTKQHKQSSDTRFGDSGLDNDDLDTLLSQLN